MDKELEPIFESGYSEADLDKNANIVSDKTQNQVKAVNIFDPKQIKKKEDEEK